MSDTLYAKGPGNNGFIRNLEVCSFSSLDGKSSMFQMALYKTPQGKYYLYGCSFGGKRQGVLINDVTDPYNPVFIKHMELVDPKEYPTTTSPKMQIADDLMIVAMSSGSGPGALVDQTKLAQIKSEAGIRIYSLKEDPENPKFLGYWDCGLSHVMGVHRFMYNGGRYVHLSADCVGFEGLIYRIIDIIDPANPVEVGRWWLPEQYADGYPGRTFDPAAPHVPEFMDKGWLHGPPFVVGDKAYCGYSGAGLVVLDVADITRPKCLGQLKLMPAFSSHNAGARTHTALPLPGRDLVVVTNEGERFQFFTKEALKGKAQALNNIHMIDVSDPGDPTLIAEFPYPEVPKDFPYKNFNEMNLGCQGPFGPHNLHEPMSGKPWLEQRGDRVYCCYFHAGLRVYDVSDPYYIKEIAYFIPPNPNKSPEESFFPGFPGPRNATTEDCIVDDRGNIIIDAIDDGFYILKMKEKSE
ncbi:LVIVD repeat-containing protein [Parasporobacterium paucivorans]|uniref:Uncharacterized conserved protein n=1 Tax=Parasporobacterium paucivorans DSM 15970 TaxID=1122934 RepID=A0A1M6DQZ9_9FIRM|nr:hypothetical protein [Parasporobacterium paucivorans]SHI75559.1 Uncharacterized conserved protein [Parasporobacterium paucivorans DSM 15970]